MTLLSRTLDQLTIRDERAFRHIPLYQTLKQRLRTDGFRFQVTPPNTSWQRVLFLNLSFWNAAEPNDVLEDESIDADVVAHAAWHHAARAALGASGGAMSADALFLGESIASAFDLYLVGQVLGRVKSSSFLKTQVPAMAQVAEDAGMGPEQFQALIEDVVADPEGAFEDLRELLFDASSALIACDGLRDATTVCARLDQHRFAPLLHHYELATWVLYARAYATRAPDPHVRAIDQALRDAPSALDWLEAQWL